MYSRDSEVGKLQVYVCWESLEPLDLPVNTAAASFSAFKLAAGAAQMVVDEKAHEAQDEDEEFTEEERLDRAQWRASERQRKAREAAEEQGGISEKVRLL